MGAESELYNIRPSFREKFRPAAVKPLISAVLAERLADKTCASPFLSAPYADRRKPTNLLLRVLAGTTPS